MVEEYDEIWESEAIQERQRQSELDRQRELDRQADRALREAGGLHTQATPTPPPEAVGGREEGTSENIGQQIVEALRGLRDATEQQNEHLERIYEKMEEIETKLPLVGAYGQ